MTDLTVPNSPQSHDAATPRVIKTVAGVPPEALLLLKTYGGLGYVTHELRVGLNDRELRHWIKRLRHGPRRDRRLVADELERAVDGAIKAGMVSRVG